MTNPIVRVIIAGTRTFTDYNTVKNFCDNILLKYFDLYNIEIISGGANGADHLGELYSETKNIFSLKIFPADWEKHGKKAGYLRNTEMAKYAKKAEYSILIAFWDGNSPGTKMMINIAEKYGIEIYVKNTLAK